MSAIVTDLQQVKKPKRILRWAEVHARTGLSRSAWNRGQRLGQLPAPIKLGPPPTRAVGWVEADIDALIERWASEAEA